MVSECRTPSEEIPDVMEKRQRLQRNFWKNVIIIGVAFMFVFMGYFPMSAVQSSLNSEKGLGVAALGIKFAAMVFGGLFTNNYLVDRLGCKWTISAGMFVYGAFIAGNFYPTLFTLLPLGIFTGVIGAAMWMAQATYLTRISNDYVALGSHLTTDGQAAELGRIKSRVFAIFFTFFYGSNALGNMASSLILSQSRNVVTNERLKYCGAAYCNEDLDHISFNDTQIKPDKAHVYALCTFCFTSAFFGSLLVVLFLDRLPTLGVSEKVTNSDSTFKLVLATMRQWVHPYQLLLIPLELYTGIESVFWSAEFTKSFVTCAVGIHYVGFVMVSFSLSTSVFVLLYNWFDMAKFRFVPFLIGMVAHLSILVVILRWAPSGTDDLPIVFAMSIIWGVGVGAFGPCTNVFISIVFRENMEAAFSNYQVWNNVGQSLSYAWSYHLCVYTKAYLMIVIVSIAIICYLIIELHLHTYSKKKTNVALQETVNAGVVHLNDGMIYGSMKMPEINGKGP